MKMTGKIEEMMFAPCGMNCMVCYKHCFTQKTKKPCFGCLAKEQTGKPEHCRSCAIKDCAKENKVSYCFECSRFPCKRIYTLEKSYTQRYNVSLMENSLYVKEHGIQAFMDKQCQAYTCQECGGVFSIHDKICTDCGAPLHSKKA